MPFCSSRFWMTWDSCSIFIKLSATIFRFGRYPTKHGCRSFDILNAASDGVMLKIGLNGLISWLSLCFITSFFGVGVVPHTYLLRCALHEIDLRLSRLLLQLRCPRSALMMMSGSPNLIERPLLPHPQQLELQVVLDLHIVIRLRILTQHLRNVEVLAPVIAQVSLRLV